MKHGSRDIILFGGIGSPDQFGGELTKNKEIIKSLTRSGHKVTAIDTYGANSSLSRMAGACLKLMKCLAFNRKAVLIISTALGNVYPLLGILSHLPFRPKIVYWGIGGLFADRIASGFFDKRRLKAVDHYIVEGEKMKKTLAGCGIHNVTVMPNFKKILPAKRTVKKPGKIRFYFLSRIIPEKGVGLILDSCNALNSSGYADRYEVDFYGPIDEKFADDFNAGVSALDNVSYLGKLNLLDPANYSRLSEYHYMLFPTYWYGEGCPGVIIDAFMTGTPVIASDWNLNPEYVKDSLNGYLFPSGDAAGLTETMKRAIEDTGSYDAMADNCLRSAGRFDTDKVINRDTLNEILC